MADMMPNLIELIKKSSSPQELIQLASENRIFLTEEDAGIYFSRWHEQGAELSDDDLDDVAGGVIDSCTQGNVCSLCGGTKGLMLTMEGGYICSDCREKKSNARTNFR